MAQLNLASAEVGKDYVVNDIWYTVTNLRKASVGYLVTLEAPCPSCGEQFETQALAVQGAGLAQRCHHCQKLQL